MPRDYRRALSEETNHVEFTEAVARLYDDASLDERLTTVLTQTLSEFRDRAEAPDAVAGLSDDDLELIAETMVRRANGGLFVLRNGALTVGDVGITTDHRIRMESADARSDDAIIEYAIVEADPDALYVRAQAEGSSRHSRFGVGQLLYGDRFEVVEP